MYNESAINKFIVFQISDYLLGLPIGDVLKVVNCPSAQKKNLETMNLVQIGRHMIRVMDWHHSLNSDSVNHLASDLSFLVITRDHQGRLCGILVDEPPNFMELPLDMTQNLPKSDRNSSIFQMISHAAVVSYEDTTTTIFLLDMKQAPHRIMSDS